MGHFLDTFGKFCGSRLTTRDQSVEVEEHREVTKAFLFWYVQQQNTYIASVNGFASTLLPGFKKQIAAFARTERKVSVCFL